MDITSLFYIGMTLLAGLILFIITQKKKPKERGYPSLTINLTNCESLTTAKLD